MPLLFHFPQGSPTPRRVFSLHLLVPYGLPACPAWLSPTPLPQPGCPHYLLLPPQLGFFKRQYKDMMTEAGPDAATPSSSSFPHKWPPLQQTGHDATKQWVPRLLGGHLC